MTVKLIYWANGGDNTPPEETKEIVSPATTASFTLSQAITKDAPTRKYVFSGWDINGTVYDAGDTVELSSSAVAKAVFDINKTTVSTKEYGRSPNGTRNALGRTRYHHQPGYPHAMGVGAKKVGEAPVIPELPEPTITRIVRAENAAATFYGTHLDAIKDYGEGEKEYQFKLPFEHSSYYTDHGIFIDETSMKGGAETSRYWLTGYSMGIKIEVPEGSTKAKPGIYTFENIIVEDE